jgi:hypothetical protein
MFILVFLFVAAVETLVFAYLIHVVYRAVYGWWKYRRIGPLEAIVIAVLTFPGFAGCAKGWVAVGVPLPLLLGIPLDFAYGSEFCGWFAVWGESFIPWVIILLLGASRLSEEAIKNQHEQYLAIVDSIPKPAPAKPAPPSNYDNLITAVINNDISSVRHYLELGVDPNMKNDFGSTSKDYARRYDHTDILCLLEQHNNKSSNLNGAKDAPPS